MHIFRAKNVIFSQKQTKKVFFCEKRTLLDEFTKKTAEYERAKIRKERDQKCERQGFAFDTCKIHGADIKHGITRAVGNAGAMRDMAIHTVTRENIRQYGDRAAP